MPPTEWSLPAGMPVSQENGGKHEKTSPKALSARRKTAKKPKPDATLGQTKHSGGRRPSSVGACLPRSASATYLSERELAEVRAALPGLFAYLLTLPEDALEQAVDVAAVECLARARS